MTTVNGLQYLLPTKANHGVSTMMFSFTLGERSQCAERYTMPNNKKKTHSRDIHTHDKNCLGCVCVSVCLCVTGMCYVLSPVMCPRDPNVLLRVSDAFCGGSQQLKERAMMVDIYSTFSSTGEAVLLHSLGNQLSWLSRGKRASKAERASKAKKDDTTSSKGFVCKQTRSVFRTVRLP